MCNKNNYQEFIKTYLEYDRIEKAAKAEKEKAKKELIEFLETLPETEPGKHACEYDGMKAAYTEYTEARFDSKVFKADNPDLYEKYRLPKKASRFTCN